MFKKKKNQTTNNGRHLITKINPKSPISEQYRTIRTNIQFSSVDKKIKTLLVTSAEPCAGKSITAANLAIVYAQQGIKTLLIDGDMRKPTIHYTFRLNNLTGLSNAIVDGLSVGHVATSSDVDHLDLISSGPVPPNPSELLASKQFKNFLSQASESYEMVIIDTPPLLAVTDSQLLAPKLDGIVLVARSRQTGAQQLEEGVEAIKRVNGNLIGTVLNDIDKTNNDNYYYYYG